MKSYMKGKRSHLLVYALIFSWIGSIAAGFLLFPPAADAQGLGKGLLHRHDPRVQAAIQVQDRHTHWLMGNPGVMGTAVGVGLDGQPVIKVFAARHGVEGIPDWLESLPVHVEVTGMIVARGNTTERYRPAYIGISTGHPEVTAGTIGARVKDSSGIIYALSNNHVYANQNDALIGDGALQPGTYDGASNTDDYRIGTLADFQPIDFTLSGHNYMDAAIVRIFDPVDQFLGISTLPDGYGSPSPQTTPASVSLPVKKYGRTTSLTHGEVAAINAYVEVCYEAIWNIFCIKSAYFYDQIAITPGTFSAGGDSGSLIVTETGNQPVGLLFAGGSDYTFANRIDRVLERFGVSIDDGGPLPTPPAAPTNLNAAAVSSNRIDLSWTDTAVNESGFKIDRCEGAGCTNFVQIAIVGADIASYSNTGLAASTTYRYQVRAYNAGGDSIYAGPAEATTLAMPALPNAPNNMNATAVSSSRIELSWNDNSDNEDGFKIERCKGSRCTNFAQIATVGADVTQYSNTGLSKRTTYRYRVRAHNAAGNSAYSNIGIAKTP